MDIGAILPLRPEPERNTAGKPAPADLPAACKNFEAYFSSCLLSSLVKTADAGQESGPESQEKKFAWNLLTQTIADKMAENQSLGLGRQLMDACLEKLGNPKDSPIPPLVSEAPIRLKLRTGDEK
jgi:Rod binding domain-containing protein